ncbi:MAG: undecaprenyl-diphosphatase UppP [Candidatus Kapaibacteriota bacterium]
MNEIIYAIIIGIVQGLTEFLPVSSTAHMTIAAKLLGSNLFDDPRIWTAAMATIQLGTLASLLFHFHKDIFDISKDFLLDETSYRIYNFNTMKTNARLGWMILIGSLPIFLLGYLLKDIIEGDFTKSLWTISSALILIAVAMFVAERVAKFNKTTMHMTLADAVIIGLAQSLALIPGVSRSGATITAGMMLGLKREEAARFSFLLSIPAVFVSGVYEFVVNFQFVSGQRIVFLVVASVFAFLSGLFAISFLLRYLKTKSTLIFVVYRFILGTTIILSLSCGI